MFAGVLVLSRMLMILPFLFFLLVSWEGVLEFYRSYVSPSFACGVLAALSFIAVLLALSARKLASLSHQRFLLGASLLILCLGTLSLCTISYRHVGDAFTLDQLGQAIAEEGFGNFVQEQKVLITSLAKRDQQSMYQNMRDYSDAYARLPSARPEVVGRVWPTFISFLRERALIYLYPIYAVFGLDHRLALVSNILYLILTGFGLYYIFLGVVPVMAARIGILLYAFSPMNYFWVPALLTDICGTFYLVLYGAFLTFFAKHMSRLSQRQALALSVVGGLILFCADFVRSILALIALSAVPLMTLMACHAFADGRRGLKARHAIKAIALMVVVPMAIAIIIRGELGTSMLLSNADHNLTLCADTTDGNDNCLYGKRDVFYSLPNSEIRHRYALGVLQESISNQFQAFLDMHEVKFTNMQNDLRQIYLMMADDPGPKGLVFFWYKVSLVLRLLLFPLAALGLARVAMQAKTHPGWDYMVAYCSVFFLALWLSEVQPRYIYPIHQIVVMMAAVGAFAIAVELRNLWRRGWQVRQSLVVSTLLTGVMAFCGFQAFVAVLPRIGASMPYPFQGLGSPQQRSLGDQATDLDYKDPRDKKFNYGLQLAPPRGSASVAWEFQGLGESCQRIGFFVRRSGNIPVEVSIFSAQERVASETLIHQSLLTYVVKDVCSQNGTLALQLSVPPHPGEGDASEATVSLEKVQITRI